MVIGGRLADTYFDQPLGINKMITIEGTAFKIVGILDSQSNTIIMPIQMAYQLLDEKEKDTYDSIVVKIKNEEDLDEIVVKIENKLMISRHVTEKQKDSFFPIAAIIMDISTCIFSSTMIYSFVMYAYFT